MEIAMSHSKDDLRQQIQLCSFRLDCVQQAVDALKQALSAKTRPQILRNDRREEVFVDHFARALSTDPGDVGHLEKFALSKGGTRPELIGLVCVGRLPAEMVEDH
jgi:hypothetical protein